jgi:agmatinase
LGIEPVQAVRGIATLDPLDVDGLGGEELAERLRKTVGGWLDRGKFVITLGGEHTSVVGAIKAHCETFSDLTIVQLDAHSDLRPSYLGDPWSHACAAARVLDFHDALVQVGIRSQDREERAFSEGKGLPVFYAHEIHCCQEEREDWIGLIIRTTRKHVYLTFDCDVLDPSVLPATGTPEPGGITWSQIDRFLARICRERKVVGLDVSELSPIPGLEYPQYNVAKLIYRFLGYLGISSQNPEA